MPKKKGGKGKKIHHDEDDDKSEEEKDQENSDTEVKIKKRKGKGKGKKKLKRIPPTDLELQNLNAEGVESEQSVPNLTDTNLEDEVVRTDSVEIPSKSEIPQKSEKQIDEAEADKSDGEPVTDDAVHSRVEREDVKSEGPTKVAGIERQEVEVIRQSSEESIGADTGSEADVKKSEPECSDDVGQAESPEKQISEAPTKKKKAKVVTKSSVEITGSDTGRVDDAHKGEVGSERKETKTFNSQIKEAIPKQKKAKAATKVSEVSIDKTKSVHDEGKDESLEAVQRESPTEASDSRRLLAAKLKAKSEKKKSEKTTEKVVNKTTVKQKDDEISGSSEKGANAVSPEKQSKELPTKQKKGKGASNKEPSSVSAGGLDKKGKPTSPEKQAKEAASKKKDKGSVESPRVSKLGLNDVEDTTISDKVEASKTDEKVDNVSDSLKDNNSEMEATSEVMQEKALDKHQKLQSSDQDAVVVDTTISEKEVMKSMVEAEVKQTIDSETKILNFSQHGQGEKETHSIKENVDKVKETPAVAAPARRNLVPGGPEEVLDGEDLGDFNRPLSSANPTPDNKLNGNNDDSQDVPEQRVFTPTEAIEVTGGGNPSAEIKAKEKVDLDENQKLEQNVLAGRVADDDDDDDELPWAMYRDLKKQDILIDDEEKFSSDDEKLGNDFKKGENLPELYEFLGSLDHGDTELESKGVPPSLFNNEQQRHMHQSVDKIKLALAEEEIGAYLEEFERHVEEEVLMIGNIGLEEVLEEERNIRENHVEYQREEACVQKDKLQELTIAMEKAKKHVMQIFKEKHGKLRDKELALMKRDNRLQGVIRKAFRRSENQLIKALRKRKAEVQEMYGDLVFADGQYGGGKGKRWKVDWNKTSQPIQIKIKCLRSVRDKLPPGQYGVLVSLYSRLGGHVLKWSNLMGQKWGAATLPLAHDGQFYNTEMKIDQSVFTVCPSKPDMRPGMVLMFELYLLSGAVTPKDEIVGWGCFPICDGSFNVVDGKCKTPLLRGNIDHSVDKFQHIEERISHDLEFWLCNLYFEIVKLPRYLTDQKEYEVELQFSSGLVSYPIRTKTGEEFVDGENPVYGSTPDMSSNAASRVSILPSKSSSFANIDDKKPGQNIKVTVDPPKRKTSRPSSGASASVRLQKASEISSELRQRRSSKTSLNIPAGDEGASQKLSIMSHNDARSLADSDDSDTGSGTDYNDNDVCAVKKDHGFRHVKGQPGMYYKVHQNNPADVYARKIFSSLPKTASPSIRRKKKKLTHLDELKQHSYNVKSIWSNKGHVPRQGREKMQYIGRMMLSELGLSQWRNSQFWITLFMLLITWFIRMYLHYFGQWILLNALSIPINRFNFHAHTVNLNYQDTLLQARHELGIVIIGPLTNFFFFCLFVPLTFCFQRFFKWFPDVITQFMLAFGIQTFLDPLWILAVDSALGRYKNSGGPEPIGDAFKLYWHFYRNYRNDDVTFYISICMTVFLYVVVAFSTAAIWYMFFVRLHNNGRLMDVYWRLHGSEEEFFLPYDLEVSNVELNYICTKAEQWRGEECERRKVAVYDYVWEQEELDEEYWDNPTAHGKKTGTKEITTHLSIHTISTDGLIELYRQFLRLPDGAIVEVFGEMNMPGIDEGVKQALMKRTGFQGTSAVVRRSRSLSVSSVASSYGEKDPAEKNPGEKDRLRRTSSNRLDVPV